MQTTPIKYNGLYTHLRIKDIKFEGKKKVFGRGEEIRKDNGEFWSKSTICIHNIYIMYMNKFFLNDDILFFSNQDREIQTTLLSETSLVEW